MKNMLAERIGSIPLTKKQKKIAKYFIENQDRIASLSSMEVAREIGVSDASIIRFSRAIGFSGFADLKSRSFDVLVENASSGLSLAERLSMNTAKYSGQDVTFQFSQLMQQNINSVFLQNRMEDFDRIVDLLMDAERRYVIGMRGCKGIAMQFGRLLAFMLPSVHTLIDSECTSISRLQDIREGDAVLMFVYSRFYKIDVNYLKMAKERGARIALVTNDETGPLSAFADVILTVATSNMSFFHSTIGADLIGEYLLNRVSKRVDYEDRIRERDEVTEYQRL